MLRSRAATSCSVQLAPTRRSARETRRLCGCGARANVCRPTFPQAQDRRHRGVLVARRHARGAAPGQLRPQCQCRCDQGSAPGCRAVRCLRADSIHPHGGEDRRSPGAVRLRHGRAPIYGPDAGWLAQSMAAAGLNPKAVTTVLVSHLHGDHIYGLMDKVTHAQISRTPRSSFLPRAEMVGTAGSRRHGSRAHPQGPFTAYSRDAREWKNVRPVDGESELVPGVRAIPAPGHTPGRSPIS